jgi:hypothetical protein
MYTALDVVLVLVIGLINKPARYAQRRAGASRESEVIVSEIEALQVAIDAMSAEVCLCEPMARDWRKYGAALQFGLLEGRLAAERADRLHLAADVLRAFLARIQRGDFVGM